MTSCFLPMLRGHRAAWAAAALLPALAAAAEPAATETVVVTGNPLGRADGARAASVLSGPALLLRRGATLGDTLDGLPGVAATGFGPNASRPVIRGLDGDRVRLLDNGGASVDASNLSFDHAAATDPLVVERIEVLRGPAALLYGGNATGGVVNAIDNRIPRGPAAGPVTGRAELRAGGAAEERSAAFVVEGGAGGDGGGGPGLVWHADGHGRRSSDLRVPTYVPVEGGVALEPTDRVRNSAARGAGGAVGAAWVGADGYAGLSVDTVNSRYGVTAEPDVHIRMRRDRLALAGEWRALDFGPLTQLSLQASRTNYRHDEVEGSGAVGTTFSSRADEWRLQARHAPVGALHGVVGLQGEALDFRALGEEAFVPATRTRSVAAFFLEELQAGPVLLGAGARAERVDVDSAGDAQGADAAEPRFGAPQQRRYSPFSAALSAQLGGKTGWQASASVGRTQRAPAYYELYADGLHVATGAYERGDPTLPAESSRHVEIGAGYAEGPHAIRLSVFGTRFARYVSLDATGAVIAVEGEDGEPATVPEYRFRAVRATMSGAELEGRTRVLTAPFALDFTAAIDAVRGSNRDDGQPLPRLAPRRLRLTAEAGFEGWRAGVGLRAAARQSRVPDTDTATPGWAMVDLWAAGQLALGSDLQWFAKLANATDRLARSATTMASMRDLAPMPGRGLTVGLRAPF